ncbi:hypothetical protein [Carboxylicivirga marina]|uniref:hypothetical protein n=1 Tax=Carboxylicivirga marina TaxID=2800988 RepID=UPI002598B072|nr:hypothetical protein [uncultured Carboxylicivirga sp.]
MFCDVNGVLTIVSGDFFSVRNDFGSVTCNIGGVIDVFATVTFNLAIVWGDYSGVDDDLATYSYGFLTGSSNLASDTSACAIVNGNFLTSSPYLVIVYWFIAVESVRFEEEQNKNEKPPGKMIAIVYIILNSLTISRNGPRQSHLNINHSPLIFKKLLPTRHYGV